MYSYYCGFNQLPAIPMFAGIPKPPPSCYNSLGYSSTTILDNSICNSIKQLDNSICNSMMQQYLNDKIGHLYYSSQSDEPHKIVSGPINKNKEVTSSDFIKSLREYSLDIAKCSDVEPEEHHAIIYQNMLIDIIEELIEKGNFESKSN